MKAMSTKCYEACCYLQAAKKILESYLFESGRHYGKILGIRRRIIGLQEDLEKLDPQHIQLAGTYEDFLKEIKENERK